MDSMPIVTAPESVDAQKLTQDSSTRTLLEQMTTYLEEQFRIGPDADGYEKKRRFVALKKQEMFNELVDIYTIMIRSSWNHFKRTAESHAPPGYSRTSSDGSAAAPPDYVGYMAKVYVSHWFIDLYVTIKECCERVSSFATNNEFEDSLDQSSYEYDQFLCLLNEAIRPTTIKGTPEEAMFIPYFKETTISISTNPLNITNFELNYSYHRTIIKSMKDSRSGWKIISLPGNTVGRPLWLFDWFTNQNMCAWFPMEPNYTSVDVLLAYLLGVACTSKLTHRHIDDLQVLLPSVNPEGIRSVDYPLQIPRIHFGAYEVNEFSRNEVVHFTFNNPFFTQRDAEITRQYAESSSKRRRTEKQPSGSEALSIREPAPTDMETDDVQEPTFTLQFNACRHTIYLYYCRLVRKSTPEARYSMIDALVTDTFQ